MSRSGDHRAESVQGLDHRSCGIQGAQRECGGPFRQSCQTRRDLEGHAFHYGTYGHHTRHGVRCADAGRCPAGTLRLHRRRYGRGTQRLLRHELPLRRRSEDRHRADRQRFHGYDEDFQKDLPRTPEPQTGHAGTVSFGGAERGPPRRCGCGDHHRLL